MCTLDSNYAAVHKVKALISFRKKRTEELGYSPPKIGTQDHIQFISLPIMTKGIIIFMLNNQIVSYVS